MASYGHDASHHCFFWGAKLMLVVTADGAVTAFGLASPQLAAEREEALAMFGHGKNLPAPGTVIVADKGFAGRDFEASLARMGLRLIRPARKDEPPRAFPGWLRQRVEAIIWTQRPARTGPPPRPRPRRGCGPASCSACRPSTPRYGTTGPPVQPSSGPSPHTTTSQLRFTGQRCRVTKRVNGCSRPCHPGPPPACHAARLGTLPPVLNPVPRNIGCRPVVSGCEIQPVEVPGG